MRKKLKETSGGISVFVIIMMVFLLPFVIWIGIEMPKTHEMNQRVKDAVDSASQAGITSISTKTERFTPDAKVIPMNHDEAIINANRVFAMKMGLKNEADNWLNPVLVALTEEEKTNGEYSNIKHVGDINVQVFDDVRGPVTGDENNPLRVQTLNGTKKIYHSTVIVDATITFEKIGVFGKDLTVTHVGMNQVKMENNH